MKFVLLLADQDFQVIQLSGLEIALYLRYLVSYLTLVRLDLHESVQVERLGRQSYAVWTLESPNTEHFAVLVRRLVRREELLLVLVRHLLLELTLVNESTPGTDGSLVLVVVHVRLID